MNEIAHIFDKAGTSVQIFRDGNDVVFHVFCACEPLESPCLLHEKIELRFPRESFGIACGYLPLSKQEELATLETDEPET